MYNKVVKIGDCKSLRGDTLLATPECKDNDLAKISGADHFNSQQFSQLFEKSIARNTRSFKKFKMVSS